ncbi:iron-siderophore ABC transporter substrate-binding protein [Vibrio tapetis subsp. quintayensis]|uniref:ABC transporter substrate-binding protein n=1 Tax=Vibrio tapetis TaxID=52443 RepID=UPI0025B4AC9D|nr:iron-siderophore ABC transporter substrate-binding protein [Vibrio tapetis]MDN3682596.1 iron-siderophore ABC transporter substrate-binding protein [Vibrio tapetis subsp. quintayensis]
MGQSAVPLKAKRVVTLFQGATDSAVALGVKPVGVVESWAEKPMYTYLREALGEVTYVGLETQPNLEEIATLKPDVIIGTKARHEKIFEQLQKIAPTVLATNVYDFKYSLELTAEATGRQQQADEIWNHWQQRIQYVQKHLRQTLPKWPLTASILNVRADHLRLYLHKSFPGAVLNEIGFQFPLEDNRRFGWGMKIKTKEALPSVNADVFFVFLHSEQPLVEQNYQSWLSHPLWNILTAPKNEQVHTVDKVTWILSGGILGANQILDQLVEIYQVPEREQE